MKTKIGNYASYIHVKEGQKLAKTVKLDEFEEKLK